MGYNALHGQTNRCGFVKRAAGWVVAMALCFGMAASAQDMIGEDATGDLTETSPLPVRLWMPESLIVIPDAASDVFGAQIIGFAETNPETLAELRIKRDSNAGPGSLITTLRSASAVAPGALPHLTLVRRADLVALVRDGLVEPMPARAASLLGDMPLAMGELGRVDGVLYGIPYLAEFKHLAYSEMATAPETWSFDSVIDARFAYQFPAQNAGINDVLYAQYQAGAEDPPLNEPLMLAEDPLRNLFDYVQRGVRGQVLDPGALQYAGTSAYAADVISGALPAGVLTSTEYLRARAAGSTLLFAPLPTANGSPAAVVDAWMWIIPTAEADEQERTVDMLFYLMDPRRQMEFAQATGALPTTRTALNDFFDVRYDAFAARVFSRALIPITADSRDAVVMRAIQNAVAAILAGETDAESALDAVLAR